MILKSQLPKILEKASRAEKVLDLGGWYQPLNIATHVIDVQPFETRRKHDCLDPENEERFSRETWIVQDVCEAPWPFPDNYFDFSFCSHLLEDVRDPLATCRELTRVAKSGYIETPSRQREIFSKARFFKLKAALGRMPEVGFYHHRWFCEFDDNHWKFIAKDQKILLDKRRFLTRADIGRKLTEQESGICHYWNDGFTFEEVFDQNEESLTQYRQEALRQLTDKSESS